MPKQHTNATESAAELAWNTLTADDDGRACKDIPEQACDEQPRNFSTHILSLSLTKSADAFVNPKLILSWLLTTMGAPAYFIGLLVPVREAGSLLPQLFIAETIRSLALRKYAWVLGSLIQGLSAAGMGIAVMILDGSVLGITIVSLLGLLALSRSMCSVSYKDVLGKTVSKAKRGTATGAASSLSAGLVIIYALVISLEVVDKLTLLTIGLFLAAGFWIIAGALFSTLEEQKGATEGGANLFILARKNFSYLYTDRELGLFILTRALLIATALAPPFMLALNAEQMDNTIGGLGSLLLASSLASLVSGYIWGRLADISSRKVLLLSGFSAGSALVLTVLAASHQLLQKDWVLPLLLFALMIAYEGVRMGRSIHLVDIADQDKRAIYTALSNSIIGLFLLLGGLFSFISHWYGEKTVLFIFALMSFLAMLPAYLMKEAQ